LTREREREYCEEDDSIRKKTLGQKALAGVVALLGAVSLAHAGWSECGPYDVCVPEDSCAGMCICILYNDEGQYVGFTEYQC